MSSSWRNSRAGEFAFAVTGAACEKRRMPLAKRIRMTAPRLAAALIMTGLAAQGRAAQSTPEPAAPIISWGDQGDGTYRNPVLNADYSDPDLIGVGEDFYLVASDFHFVGIQVLHSRDLVNWRIIGQVFNRLTMHPRYDEMAGYSQGTWAPSLRFHNGEFFLYVCTPHDGLYMWHTKNPAGPWSEMVTVKTVDRWEDPCPFWDGDGQGYLVHSVHGAGPLILHRLSADGTQLLDDGVEIYRGPVAEGPKMFKRHGWYYISLPEGGVEKGGQTVLRAKNLYGPYERRVVLPDASPHQGGIVELPSGEAWFLGFKFTGYLGRVSHLEPVKWGEDDWPVFGDNGQPVQQWKKPNVGRSYPVARPQASDEFDAPGLSLQWQWNHNPVNEAWSLTERPGWLRLKARPAAAIALARNTLTQKIWDDTGVVDVKLDVRKMADGQRAGFTFMSGKEFGWVGVAQVAGVRRIAWEGGSGPEVSGGDVWLRGTNEGDAAHLWFSLDGKTFTDTGAKFQLKFSQWKGARFGVFSFGDAGTADVDYIRYNYGKR
jgi:beta-xylosidase